MVLDLRTDVIANTGGEGAVGHAGGQLRRLTGMTWTQMSKEGWIMPLVGRRTP